MHRLLLFQGNIFLVLAQLHCLFFLLGLLLRKLNLLIAENTDIILVSFHVLLGLVIAHLVFAPEEV
jgi:hypothetical protein